MKQSLILFVSLIATKLFSQDIRGAYIRFESTAPLGAYSISVTVFSEAALDVNRPTIALKSGDGYTLTCALSSSSTSNGINIKTYTVAHSYPGQGTYNVSYTDSFYVAGIKNLSNSSSQKITAYATIYSSMWAMPDASLEVTSFPLTYTASSSQLFCNPGYMDADGDSLSYFLSVQYPPAKYHIPADAVINPATGLLAFSKDSSGHYGFPITVREWRKNSNGQYVVIGESQIEYVFDVLSTVGISEQALTQRVEIFPNPTNNIVTIKTGVQGVKKISLLDVTGRHLMDTQETGEQFILDMSGYTGGVYILYVRTEAGLGAGKIVRE